MSEPKLALRDITVRRGARTILEIPELGVSAGEIFAVVGPNGAGKSTLVQVMALLERPSKGQALFVRPPVMLRQLEFSEIRCQGPRS